MLDYTALWYGESVMSVSPDPELIDQAVAALRRGELVGMPTETVYGLAADARNASALRKVFALKQRPIDHPLIVHLPSADHLRLWADEVSETAWTLAKEFWPGPLTMILRCAAGVPSEVTGGQETIGLRVPAHPVALALLRAFDGGLAAPSANRFGRISPTRAADVSAEFGEALPLVLDGGPCTVGIESTIVDLSMDAPSILRPGMIRAAQIEAVIGPLAKASVYPRPRVSGSMDRHYAPVTPLLRVDRTTLEEIAGRDEQVRVLALGTPPLGTQGLGLPEQPELYARGLYAALRELDQHRARQLLVEEPPDSPEWLAVLDRLQRAAAGSGEESEPHG